MFTLLWNSFISHASKEGLCPKSFKLDFSRTWTKNFQMCKLDWKKAEEVEIKLPTILGSRRRQKTATSASLTMLKHLTVWITINCGKSLKKSEYQTTLPASWEPGRRVKNQHLEPYMEKLTGSKLGKEYDKAVYCHPTYLTSMQSTSYKMLDWMNHRLESRLPGEISTTSDMQITLTLWQKAKRN